MRARSVSLSLVFRGVERRSGRATALSAVLLIALSLTIASPAQATPNTGKAWGNNEFGQLGDGSHEGPERCGFELLACSTTPLHVAGLPLIEAGGGRRYSAAIVQGGNVMTWGLNIFGQLGDGNEANSDVPVPVSELSGVKAVAVGWDHVLALLEGGTVVAWGRNEGSGQLGNGTTTNSDVPVAVCAPAPEPCPGSHLSGVKAIAAGESHSLALLENGTVVAWGNNEQGELGNATTANSDLPAPVKELSGVRAIAAGEAYSLALLEDGTVVAWGHNNNGELGNGTTTNSDLPVPVKELSGVGAIAAGSRHALALLEGEGKLMTWGLNSSGQLGDGTSEGPEKCGEPVPTRACATKPVPVSNLSGVKAIAAGEMHSLALLEGGALWSWGRNEQGQLGDGFSTGPEGCGTSGACSKVPVRVCAEGTGITCSGTGPYLVGATGIAAGADHSLAFGPPPAVTGVKPRKGPVGGGTTVTIAGTDFTGATGVKFGSTNAASFKVNSATSITALAPAEPAGRVDVTVTNSWGTSATSKADRFMFTPTVTGLSPNGGPTAGGTSVTVTGTGFALGTTATTFRFGSTKAKSIDCTSSTECTVASPPHEAGTVDVKAIVNRVSSPRNRPADQFTYS
jgi:alpha-tubulin suppressor-like RCC1 family protein